MHACDLCHVHRSHYPLTANEHTHTIQHPHTLTHARPHSNPQQHSHTHALPCFAGRIVFAHEGGYSKEYVPFCGLAVMEVLTGAPNPKGMVDPFLLDAKAWGYQDLMAHQVSRIECLRWMI